MRFIVVFICLLASIGSAWSATTEPITFAKGSRAWGDPYASPSATRDGPLVVLSGVVRVSATGTFGRLPVGMRPAQDIIVRQTKGTHTIRIDIKTDGHMVAYGTGAQIGNWVSLDGLAFTTQLSEHLSLANGVTNYGDRFGQPRGWKHHDLVILSGLVWAKHGLVTTLPPNLRPAEHQIIPAKTDAGTARLDIYPDGRVVWLNGPGRWVSLADVRFPARQGAVLPTGPGYVHYTDVLQGDFGKARALKMGDFTILSGLLFRLRTGEAVRLPSALRTQKNRLFAGFAGSGTPAQNADVRMDSTADGKVNLSEGGPAGGWLTLAGQVFVHALDVPLSIEKPPAHTGGPLAPDERSSWVNQLRSAFGNLPVYGDLLRDLATAQLTRKTGEGFVWFEKTVRLFEQDLLLCLYMPKGAQKPNFAVVTPRGIDISVTAALAAFKDIGLLDPLSARMVVLGVAPGN
jgi:hypothetical protein